MIGHYIYDAILNFFSFKIGMKVLMLQIDLLQLDRCLFVLSQLNETFEVIALRLSKYVPNIMHVKEKKLNC